MALLPPSMLDLILQAINALLVREAWARNKLRPHGNKRVHLDANGLSLSFQITGHGLLQACADADLPKDVSLTVLPGKWAALMSNDTARRMSAVRIAGDAALAQVLADLARDLRWDVEDDLAGLLGDIPARRLVRGGRSLASTLRDGVWRMAQNGSEYLTHEAALLATPHQLEQWSSHVSRLRDDAERSAKRLAWLEQRVTALSGPVAGEH